jgi:hypothetical protein
MVNINDSVTSPDGALKVTLTAFDPRRGEGRLKIEELQAGRGRTLSGVECLPSTPCAARLKTPNPPRLSGPPKTHLSPWTI